MPVHSREEAKQNPHQESLQVVARVTAGLQRIVEVVDDGHRFKVDRIVILEAVLLVAGNEGELVNMAVKLGEGELGRLDPESGKQGQRPLHLPVPGLQGKAGEVGDNDVLRHLVLRVPHSIGLGYIRRLAIRLAEILASTLVLDEQGLLPKRSIWPYVPGNLFDRLLERRHRPTSTPKTRKNSFQKVCFSAISLWPAHSLAK